MTRWKDASLATPHPNDPDKVTYAPATEVLAREGPARTAQLLMAVGYFTVKEGTVARLDRTAWAATYVDMNPSQGRPPPKRRWPHHYRTLYTADVITGVPEEVITLVAASDSAFALDFDDFMPKRNVSAGLRTYAEHLSNHTDTSTTENYAMPTIPTPAAEIDLSNLPAVQPIPMKTVIVVFDEGGTEYTYFAPETAKVGDYAVVYAGSAKLTPANRSMPFSVGQILRDTPDNEGKARAAVLGTFNEEFAKVVQQHMDLRAAVKAKLQLKKRQFEERAIFEMLAEKDPEARELLDALKKLEG